MHGKPLLIDFADFWPTFDKTDNWIWNLLTERFDVQLSDEPRLLVYSCYGNRHRSHSGLRLFVSHENRGWGFSRCDWAITSDYVTSPRHLRVPLWATMMWADAARSGPPTTSSDGRGFAATVVSNGASPTRERVHNLLDTYREVASGGRHRNNVGGPVNDKHSFISGSKFVLAFENSSFPGYTTEKLLHALHAGAVPIYWGDPLVGRDFNTKRFINFHEFPDDEALLRRVVELDQDDAQYRAMLDEPWFKDGALPECADPSRILDFFERAVADTSTPVAQRRWRPDTLLTTTRDRHAVRRRFLDRIT